MRLMVHLLRNLMRPGLLAAPCAAVRQTIRERLITARRSAGLLPFGVCLLVAAYMGCSAAAASMRMRLAVCPPGLPAGPGRWSWSGPGGCLARAGDVIR